MSEDDFMEIINNNSLDKLQSESDMYNITVQDLVMGLHHLSAAMVVITGFINSFMEDEEPAMTIDSVVHAKDLFENANKFVMSSSDNDYDDEDDEEDEDYYDDDDDSDEDDD